MIWLVLMLPLSALFTGIGVFAWRRKKPMWFWSGSTVDASEIRDIPAYNRANGIMWLVFSLPFWISTALGFFHMEAGGICLIVNCAVGISLLPFVYGKIYKHYKKDTEENES